MAVATDNIKHLVCLMMENRSFDHMLGFMASPSYPVDGLTGNETNPDSQGVPVWQNPQPYPVMPNCFSEYCEVTPSCLRHAFLSWPDFEMAPPGQRVMHMPQMPLA